MPNMNYFFPSALHVLLKIIPIVCVNFILQSTESLCSQLTPEDKRFMTALRKVHSHPSLYVAPCSMKPNASLLS